MRHGVPNRLWNRFCPFENVHVVNSEYIMVDVRQFFPLGALKKKRQIGSVNNIVVFLVIFDVLLFNSGKIFRFGSRMVEDKNDQWEKEFSRTIYRIELNIYGGKCCLILLQSYLHLDSSSTNPDLYLSSRKTQLWISFTCFQHFKYNGNVA